MNKVWPMFWAFWIGLVVAVVVFGGSGCAIAHTDVSTDRCRDLETRYEAWGAIAVAGAALGGSGAVITSAPDDQKLRIVTGAGSAALVALSAAAAFVRDDVLTLYDAECGTSTVGE